MAITNSAKKAWRQNLRHKKANVGKKEKIKKLVKELKSFVSQKKTDEAKKLLPEIFKFLDKAAKTGLIKEGAAARKKSRMSKMVSGAKKD